MPESTRKHFIGEADSTFNHSRKWVANALVHKLILDWRDGVSENHGEP